MKSTSLKINFVDGPIDGVIYQSLECYNDSRGWLVELFRADQLPTENVPQMAYLCETLPGQVRGPHEHREQSDLFTFVGPGELELYLWDVRKDSPTYGNRRKVSVGKSNRQCVIVPPGVVHAFKNSGNEPAWALNAPNMLYAGVDKKSKIDEIRYEDDPDSPFVMD